MGSVLGSDDRWCVPLPEINCSVLLTGRLVVSYRSDTCSHLPRHSSNSIHLWSQFGLAAADADRTYWFSTASFQCLIWYFKKEKKNQLMYIDWKESQKSTNKKVKCSFSIIQMRFCHNPATRGINKTMQLLLLVSWELVKNDCLQTSDIRCPWKHFFVGLPSQQREQCLDTAAHCCITIIKP